MCCYSAPVKRDRRPMLRLNDLRLVISGRGDGLEVVKLDEASQITLDLYRANGKRHVLASLVLRNTAAGLRIKFASQDRTMATDVEIPHASE